MKKFVMLFAAALSAAVFTGCTSVSSAKNFNGVRLGVGEDHGCCHSYVSIPGFYIFGLPIFCGSAAEDGKTAMFHDTLKNENAIYLLTKEIKKQGGAKVVNVNTVLTSRFVFPFCTFDTMQASGTGLRNRDEAVKHAVDNYESGR